MSKIALANKYRPNDWDLLVEQSYIKEILQNQIETDTIKNAYLFCGGAGTGKTTSARIFANKINNGEGQPIEIDGASNNGTEQMRQIIEQAKFKPLASKYKCFIIDECHSISNQGWQCLLKLLEEPPKTAVFIFCTTEPDKVPKTILSRVQRYDFQKISFEGIVNRLDYIMREESRENPPAVWDKEALEYIAKVAEGGMRDAISMLDKCISYSNQLIIENVVKALGISDYESLYQLLFFICCGHRQKCIEIIENIYRQGKDLKLFIKQFIQFILDTCKYLLYENYDYIQIPNTIDLSWFKGNNINANYELLLSILDKIIKLNNDIKYEQNPKVLIESEILLLCKGE